MSRLREESGFTLIELQVVIVLMIVILGAVLTTFNQNEVTQRVNQDQNDAQSQNRRAIDGIVRKLRNVASSSTQSPRAIERVDDYELIFRTVEGQSVVCVRYFVEEGGTTLWSQSSPSPANASDSCPGGPWSQARAIAQHVASRAAGVPVFVGNTDDPLSVDSLRVEVLVDIYPGRSPTATRLSSGVFLRNQNRAPVALATVTDTGTRLLLNGSGSEDPEGSTLKSYEWFVDGQKIGPEGPVVYWQPTAAQHTIVLRVTDAGRRTSDSEPVVVN